MKAIKEKAMSNETDLDWLARNVHVWPAGDHQPWCYVYMVAGGAMKASGNFLDAVAYPIRITKGQWLSRRAELQSKPSWEDAPEWANWLGQTASGEWEWYGDHINFPPTAGDLYWYHDGQGYPLMGVGMILGDWRDTLERRPEEFKPSIEEANRLAQDFKPFVSIEDNQEQEMKQDNGWFKRGDLPPVGSNVTIVEIDGLGISDLDREFIGEECKVMATFVRPAIFHGDEAKIVAVMEPAGGCCCFRLEMVKPIRTERDVLISVIIDEMNRYDTDAKLADAILAAGFKLEVKLCTDTTTQCCRTGIRRG